MEQLNWGARGIGAAIEHQEAQRTSLAPRWVDEDFPQPHTERSMWMLRMSKFFDQEDTSLLDDTMALSVFVVSRGVERVASHVLP